MSLNGVLSRLPWIGITLAMIAVASWAPDAAAQCVQVDNLNIRVGRPLVVRGPDGTEMDGPFHELRLSNGTYRGFSANGTTYKIDGPEPWSMGWPRTAVLGPGGSGTYAECGRWLNGAHRYGGIVHGFFHAEQSCNYSINQTHKSFAYATSSNEGLSWSVVGQIITGRDAPTVGRITGEGDCTVLDGKDGYYYAYCLRASDWRTIVARAPLGNPGPGQWYKYYAGSWSQPGLGGQASSLGFVGTGAARWTPYSATLILGVDAWFGGLKASVSCDRTSFTTIDEPLLPLDASDWQRPAPTELVAYPSMMSYDAADNQIGSSFLLTHVYIQPGEDFSSRYLVFRDVWTWASSGPVTPQVGVALSRWYNAAQSDRWTTIGPVPGGYSSYAFEGVLGYMMTEQHPALASTKLEECVSSWPGHPDHLLTNDGTCEPGGYTRLRTAGWVYASQQPGTVPLYRCYNPLERHHFASTDADCEDLGTMEWRLGWALAS